MGCCSPTAMRKIQQTVCDMGDLTGIDWDNFGFGLVPTDYMYVMKCGLGGVWKNGELQPFGNLEISPCAGVLNYGQGVFEGLKAYRSDDGHTLLFRPQVNTLRMIEGADRMSMPSPDTDTFVNVVKETVLANKRWDWHLHWSTLFKIMFHLWEPTLKYMRDSWMWKSCLLRMRSFALGLLWLSTLWAASHMTQEGSNDGAVGEVAQELYSALTSIQMGQFKDELDWVVELK